MTVYSPKIFQNRVTILNKEYKQITLRFPKEMAYRVYDEFDETQIQRQENGDLIASAKMPEDTWLIGFLLSFWDTGRYHFTCLSKNVLAQQAKLIYEKTNLDIK